MKYKYFIPQNIAPKNAKNLAIFNENGKKIQTFPLGKLNFTKGEKLYSFGLISDLHIFWQGTFDESSRSDHKLDNILTYFENNNCVMCVACGDLTQTGFWNRTKESDPDTQYFDEKQFSNYKRICDKHQIPLYELCGNHESYFDEITKNTAELKEYAGQEEISYIIEQNNDLFILLGQPSNEKVISDEHFLWLKEILEQNKNKRCFIFVHAYIEEDSGDPLDVRENSIFESWGQTNKKNFMELLKQYKNTILFHGHSHMKFENQIYDKNANYTEKNGFKSVHVPSCAVPRDINFYINPLKSKDDKLGSQGYLVDVYDDCIVLNGIDFIKNEQIPLATYKINTII